VHLLIFVAVAFVRNIFLNNEERRAVSLQWLSLGIIWTISLCCISLRQSDPMYGY